MTDTRRSFSLGRDQFGRFVQLVEDQDGYELHRAAGGREPAAKIVLSADQMRDLIFTVERRR